MWYWRTSFVEIVRSLFLHTCFSPARVETRFVDAFACHSLQGAPRIQELTAGHDVGQKNSSQRTSQTLSVKCQNFRPGRPPRPPGGPDMILGHHRLARHCVWSSGAAHAAPGSHRRRLLDLKARRSEVERSRIRSRKFSEN